MKKVLLHICCANCATVCIERLQGEGFSVSGFFYNPNIHPLKEYEKRKKDLELVSKNTKIQIFEEDYLPKVWFDFIKGYEKEKEQGTRCQLCYTLRLKETYQAMLKKDFDFFTTTLTISPHKKSNLINQVGTSIGQEKFLVRDFKKRNGFKESVKASSSLGLYRQHYCGCVFSQPGRRKELTK